MLNWNLASKYKNTCRIIFAHRTSKKMSLLSLSFQINSGQNENMPADQMDKKCPMLLWKVGNFLILTNKELCFLPLRRLKVSWVNLKTALIMPNMDKRPSLSKPGIIGLWVGSNHVLCSSKLRKIESCEIHVWLRKQKYFCKDCIFVGLSIAVYRERCRILTAVYKCSRQASLCTTAS